MLKQQHLERKETYPLEDIFQHVRKQTETHLFHGDAIKLLSLRYKTFFHKGTTCVTCGVEGSFFAKERHMKRHKIRRGKGNFVTKHVPDIGTTFHFNLYGINENGQEVLLTKDHIIPKSRGGKDHLNNLQPMCTRCNEKKGSSLPN